MPLADIFPVAIEHVSMPGDDVTRALASRGWDIAPYGSKPPPFRPELFLARRHGRADGGRVLAAAAAQFDVGANGSGTALISVVRTSGIHLATAAAVMQVLVSSALLPVLATDIPMCMAFESTADDPALARTFSALAADRTDGVQSWLRSRLGKSWLPTHESETAGWVATEETIRRIGATLRDPRLVCPKSIAVRSGSYHLRLQPELPTWFEQYSDLVESMATGAEAKMALPLTGFREAAVNG